MMNLFMRCHCMSAVAYAINVYNVQCHLTISLAHLLCRILFEYGAFCVAFFLLSFCWFNMPLNHGICFVTHTRRLVYRFVQQQQQYQQMATK